MANKQQANHVMLDLETMSTRKGAVIVQIGAVRFNPYGAPLPKEPQRDAPNALYINVEMPEQIEQGAHVDGNTIKWWLGQAAEQRRALFDPKPVPIRKALTTLKAFIDWQNDCVWSKGPGFDMAIISEAAARIGDRWGVCDFTHERCVRTVLDWAKIDENDYRDEFLTLGHNAFADAWYQAILVQQAARNLGLSSFPEEQAELPQ